MRISFMRPASTTAAIVAAAGLLAGGLALRPAFAVVGPAVVNPDTNCNISTQCKSYKNAGIGVGLLGTNSNVSTNGAGLKGTATGGGVGVVGASNTGIAVSGSSASGVGVYGITNGNDGVLGAVAPGASTGAGIQGNNNAGTTAVRANGFGGPLFDGNNSAALDVFEVLDNGFTFVAGSASVTGLSGSDAIDAGTSAAFRGVVGEGNIGLSGFGDGSNPFGVLAFNNGNGSALGVEDLTGSGILMDGFDSGNNLKYEIGDDGTVYAHNFVIAFDRPDNQKTMAYVATSTTPNIEDFGEAQLTGGQAYVSLKRTFGAEIDSRVAYMVFITPEGDTRGLYVTQKTPAGFLVRENQGGRSDAAFSYRIVAKPFGSAIAPPRLAAAPPHRLPMMPKLHRTPKTKP